MRFHLFQANGRLGDIDANSQKIKNFCQSFNENDCTLLPSLPLIHHPYQEIAHVGGFFERIQKHTLQKNNSPLIFQTLSNQSTFAWNFSGNITENQQILTIQNIHIFAPHQDNENFEYFLQQLNVPSHIDFIYLATAHTFYEGLDHSKTLIAFAQKHQKPVVYLNACGATDGTLYAGNSMLILQDGTIALKLAPFTEDSTYFDFENNSIHYPNKEQKNYSQEALLFLGAKQAIQDYAQKTGISKAVIGLSGGMDSALVAAITSEAIGSENITGIIMPSQYNSQESMDDAILLAKNLGIAYYILPITDIARSFESVLAPSFSSLTPLKNPDLDTTPENIQARTRGNLLTAFANRIGAMVISTGNKSEAAMGYCTLYGDTVGAIEPIADIYKSRAYAIAQWFNNSKQKELIPHNVFIKAPTAELKPNQKDEDSLPPYPYLDAVLYQLMEQGKKPEDITEPHLSKEQIQLIYHRLKISEFKRKQSPFAVILTSCPFGKKWNPPSCAKIF